MKKKTSPEMTVLMHEVKTNLKSMLNDVGELPQELWKEAVNNGLHPTGPQCWEYEWESQNPDADFKLRIMLPVATFGKPVSPAKFTLTKAPGITHLSNHHYGAWDNLKNTYAEIMAHVADKKMVPGNISREIYLNCDFEKPENCITEVQFQVQ